MDFEQQLTDYVSQIEGWLKGAFAGQQTPADLREAMEYSLLAGGKRIRPVLVLAVCQMCGGDIKTALPLSAAVEMIHTYSLIHDDLPAMDNDDLRRGRPTNHKVYGEATAILAGDGMIAAAFEAVATAPHLSDAAVVEAVRLLSKAAGANGMVGGQAMDMAGEGRALSRAQVEQLQDLKTGALIRAAGALGCIAAGASVEQCRCVDIYAQKLGLAFQVRDDMLDVEGDSQALGKTVGSDAANEKVTFVSLLGLEGCRQYVEELTGAAVNALEHFPHGAFLIWLANRLQGRVR